MGCPGGIQKEIYRLSSIFVRLQTTVESLRKAHITDSFPKLCSIRFPQQTLYSNYLLGVSQEHPLIGHLINCKDRPT